MSNVDNIFVQGQRYNIVSPEAFGDYVETIGGACINRDGYAAGEIFLAKTTGNVQSLYVATSEIRFGVNIIVGTNCAKTSLSKLLLNMVSDAEDVEYNNSTSGLDATNVQDAIDELKESEDNLSASDISYDNTDSELTAEDVQEAIDEVAADNQALTNQDNAFKAEIADMVNYYGAKNILSYKPYQVTDYFGITITPNNDGTITVNGTNTAPNNWTYQFTNRGEAGRSTDIEWLKPYCGKLLLLSSGTTEITLVLQFWKNGNYISASNVPVPDWGDFDEYQLFFSIVLNGTYNNVVVKPMLRLASIQDDTYEPYTLTNQELTDKITGKVVSFEQAELTFTADGTKTQVQNLTSMWTDLMAINNALDSDEYILLDHIVIPDVGAFDFTGNHILTSGYGATINYSVINVSARAYTAWQISFQANPSLVFYQNLDGTINVGNLGSNKPASGKVYTLTYTKYKKL